jgi:hypothetical protein
MNRLKLLLPLSALILTAMLLLMGNAAPSIAQGTKDPCRDEEGNEICPHYNSFDDRVNYLDPLASMAGFCRPNGSLDIWIVTNDRGQYVYTVSPQQLSDGLGRALATGQAVLIADAAAMQVLALPSNQFMLRDARNGYEFAFSPALCKVTPSISPAAASAATPSGSSSSQHATVAGEVQTTRQVNFRALPSQRATLIKTLPTGAVLKVLGRTADNQWLNVQVDGELGWVATGYTNIRNRVLFRLPIIKP